MSDRALLRANEAAPPIARAMQRVTHGASAFVHKFWFALVAIALAALVQTVEGTSTDVSWLITLCEKILSGQRPYIDFIETNPPGAIYIYLPGVIFAHALGFTPELGVAIAGFVAIGLSLFFCAQIFTLAGIEDFIAPAGAAIAIVVLAVLPSRTFDQREHMAIIFALPFFATLIARASGADVGAGLRVAAGLCAALMMSIKPYFALMVAAAVPYLLLRLGWKKFLASIELYAAAGFVLIYVALIAICLPVYLSRIAPIAAAVYVPVRAPLPMLALNQGAILWAGLAVVLLAFGRGRLKEPLIAIPALASLGAIVSFFLQGKGWPYQAYPALALIAFAVAPIVLRALAMPPRANVVAAAASAVALAFGFILLSPQGATAPEPIEKIVAALAPHPKILVIGPNIALGHPLTRRVSGEWVGTPNCLWITAMAKYLLRHGPVDTATRARFEAYMRFERETLVSDIRNRTPDAILMADDSWKGWAFADPDISAALAAYAPVGGAGKVEVYGLRPALRPSQ